MNTAPEPADSGWYAAIRRECRAAADGALMLLRPILEQERGGTPGRLLRSALSPLGQLAATVAAGRRRHWTPDRQWRAPVPVISVGNITAGGTGKTPCVVAMAEWLAAAGVRPGVVMRGYRAVAGGPNDEERLIRETVPSAIVRANPDRRIAIAEAVAEGAGAIILDDGFQHLRVARDLDIVLVDATAPFGGGSVLPAGLLREPPEALAVAGAIVITRSDQVPAEALRALEGELDRLAPAVPRFRAVHQPAGLATLGGGAMPLSDLAGARVLCACAIARPEAFIQTVRTLGAEIGGECLFPDHHAFDVADAARMQADMHRCGARAIVLTAKDAVKLRLLPDEGQPKPAWVVSMRFELPDNADALRALALRAAEKQGGAPDGASAGGMRAH